VSEGETLAEALALVQRVSEGEALGVLLASAEEGEPAGEAVGGCDCVASEVCEAAFGGLGVAVGEASGVGVSPRFGWLGVERGERLAAPGSEGVGAVVREPVVETEGVERREGVECGEALPPRLPEALGVLLSLGEGAAVALREEVGKEEEVRVTLGEPEAEEGAEKLPPAPPAPASPADALVVGEEAEEGDTVGAAGVGVGLSLREGGSEDEGSAEAHAVTLEEAAREGEGVRLAARVPEVPALGEAATVPVSEGSNEGVGRALVEGSGDAMGEGVVLSHDDAEAFAFALAES
jgi:hypothetical protein